MDQLHYKIENALLKLIESLQNIHLVVTGGGLSLDKKRWIETDPRFLKL